MGHFHRALRLLRSSIAALLCLQVAPIGALEQARSVGDGLRQAGSSGSEWAGVAVLVAVLGLASVWLAGVVRRCLQQQRLRLQIQARQQERERIARDLHDTLLQGVSALALHVQAAARTAPEGSPVREKLEHALQRAAELIEEGRDRVAELRVPPQLRGDMTDLLQARCENLSELFPGPATRVVTQGQSRQLQAPVADELYYIAVEALLNAFRHAGAKRIAVRLYYGSHYLCLVVRDDGCGIPLGIVSREGQFGLIGMRERAARIGARIEWAAREVGTEVVLTVPAARAYEASGELASVT